MRHDGGNLPVEEVQDPVMNAARRSAKLMDSIAQEVRLGPPQFMAKFAKPFDPDEDLVFRMGGQSLNQLRNGAEPSSSR